MARKGLGPCCGFDPEFDQMDISPRVRLIVRCLLAVAVLLVAVLVFVWR